jgi:hypothetical protein
LIRLPKLLNPDTLQIPASQKSLLRVSNTYSAKLRFSAAC